MLHRFPPEPSEATWPAFLAGDKEVFARLKLESLPGRRTVFMTEHTLIFVQKGIKLLHLPGQTIEVAPDNVILLRKGIYVMAEYIESGLSFEALMLFLPGSLLRSFALDYPSPAPVPLPPPGPCEVFPATSLVKDFCRSFRNFFEHRPSNFETLLPLKQKEILLLLMESGAQEKVNRFIHAAISTAPETMDFVMQHYLLQPVSIAELASLCNRSLARFKRDFQQQYHTSPRAWINQKRLEHATLLLQHTDQPISDISLACGFENTSYFIRLYRHTYGVTPGAKRAKTAID